MRTMVCSTAALFQTGRSAIRFWFLLMASLVPAVLVLLFLVGSSAAAPGDTVADRVFSQGSITPVGMAVDGAGNLYVADYSNNRVLEYDSPLTTDTVADRVFGQGGSFTSNSCNLGGISGSSLCDPQGVALDVAGNLYVGDTSNNRVLEYDSPLTTDTVADRVFGQGGSFTSNTCNLGGISANSLCYPEGVALDAAGNLYVAEFSNHRVLEYDTPLTTDAVADRVFGQGGSFTSGAPNQGGISASSLYGPQGVALDAAGNLYVADGNNERVLEYDSPLTTDTVADRVFGQGGSFTSNTCNPVGISASSLCGPQGVGLDAAGDLYVADSINHRVLEYDTPLTTDTVADRVFGQGGSFTSNTCNLGGISASSLCEPEGVALDPAGNLYVADTNNGRVLEYDDPLATATPTPTQCGACTSTPTPTPTPTSTPTPTPTFCDVLPPLTPAPGCLGTPTPSPTPIPTPTPPPTPSPTPTGGHDVGVAGHGLGFNAPNTVQAGHTTAIHIRLQNFGSVTETQIGYRVTATCSGTCGTAPTLSAACTGTVGPLAPGNTKVVNGCTATFASGTTGDMWLLTLMVVHCGADGAPPCTTNDVGADANNSNNVVVTKVVVA